MKKTFLPILFLLLAVSCEQVDLPATVSEGEGPVLFTMETKSLGPGEHTFRVSLFHPTTRAFAAQGTYCSESITPGASGTWLSPCRVNQMGQPSANGSDECTLAEADRDSKYGLRYGSNGYWLLVAASPARAYTNDGNKRFYTWEPDSPLYLSDTVHVNLNGSWFDNQFIYKTDQKENLVMKDRRARLKIHLECGELNEAHIQSVRILNRVTKARWYLTEGFSKVANIETGTLGLYDWSTDGILHLEKNAATEEGRAWTSTTELYIPAVDYANRDYAFMRPQIEVRMGTDTDHPLIALVDLTKTVEPMTDNTFKLLISKANVVVTLTSANWDEGGTHGTDVETPSTLGGFGSETWTVVPVCSSDDWNDSL